MPTAVLISVTSQAAADDFDRLVRSLQDQNAEIVHLVVRRGQQVAAAQPLTQGNYRRFEIEAPLRISLSAARNLAIDSEHFDRVLRDADMVAFPDDDCAYPTGLIDSIGRLFAEADFVTVPYGPDLESLDVTRFPKRRHEVSLADVMTRTSSNTFFVSPALARAVGRFDESLGLGTPLNSSEDAEYLARALGNGFRGRYVGDEKLIALHPYKQQRPGQYYVGNVALLARYASAGVLPAGLFVRRLAGGLVLVTRRQLPLREYLRALRVAVAQFGKRGRH